MQLTNKIQRKVYYYFNSHQTWLRLVYQIKNYYIDEIIYFTYTQLHMFLHLCDSIFQTRQQIDNVQAKYLQ